MAWHPLRGQPGSGQMGVCYLLAFDEPVGHAWHYRGWSDDDLDGWTLGLRSDSPPELLPARLAAHAKGTGARLVAVAKDRGIGWTLAWFEPGDRHRERQRKNCGAYARRDCSLCAAGAPHRKDHVPCPSTTQP